MGASKYRLSKSKKNGFASFPRTLVEAIFWDKKKKPLEEVLDGKIDQPMDPSYVGKVPQVAQDGTVDWVVPQAGATADSAMSDSSTNAPQNKVVKAYVDTVDGKVSELGQRVGTNETDIVNLQQAVNAIDPIIINGNVTNAPDEEDITTDANDLLKFKDRTTLNGMGYKILRTSGTFASQVTDQNTIYEIRYDFDLDGASVTIPAGCVLKFVGGSLSNGGIKCDMFEIDGDTQFLRADSFLYISQGNTADYLRIIGDCHILFKQVSDGVMRELEIVSDKESNIQVNGYCCYQVSASSCKFERVSTEEYCFWIESFASVEVSHTFYNCIIYSNNISTKPSDDYVKIYIFPRTGAAEVSASFDTCVIENTPIQGNYINVLNCKIIIGANSQANYETLHLGGISRIIDCDFDGRKDSGYIHNGDIIDLYGSNGSVVENCFFHDIATNSNLITIKTHYNLVDDQEVTPPVYCDRVVGCRFERIDHSGNFQNCIDIINGPRDGQQYVRERNLIGVEIANNTFIDCSGIRIICGDGVSIHHNTIIRQNNTRDISFVYIYSGDPAGMYYQQRDISICDNTILLNKLGGQTAGPQVITFSTRSVPVYNLELCRNRFNSRFFGLVTADGMPIFRGSLKVIDNTALDTAAQLMGYGTQDFDLSNQDVSAVFRGNSFAVVNGVAMSYDNNVDTYSKVIKYKGRTIYSETDGKSELWDGEEWVDLNGFSLSRVGSSLPTKVGVGFTFFHTTFGKLLVRANNNWQTIDGDEYIPMEFLNSRTGYVIKFHPADETPYTTDMCFEIEYKIRSYPTSGYIGVIGNEFNGAYAYKLMLNSSSQDRYYWGSENTPANNSSIGDIIKVEMANYLLIRNGVTITTPANWKINAKILSHSDIYILGMLKSGGATYDTNEYIALKSFKIYADSTKATLLFDGVAAKDFSGVECVYDKVSKTFLYFESVS